MLSHPSPKFFRQLLLFGFIVWISTYIVTYTDYDVKSRDELVALDWNGFGSTLSETAFWVLLGAKEILFGVGLMAMLMFRGWGRFLILGSLLIEFLSTSFMGLIVFTGPMDMLCLLYWVLVWIPLVLSFFEPCSSYFNRSKKA